MQAMRIVATGIATVDVINTLTAYPAEDQEVRALAQRICRGGNATNTLVVLSQLGHRCSWCGVIADDPDSRLILEDLACYDVSTRYTVEHAGGRTPVSYVSLSQERGSRTIVHYRRLPEYRDHDFAAVPRDRFDWFHFEGRNIPELEKMLRRCRVDHCSLEVEKPREGIERLFPLARLLLFSGLYARYRGFPDGASFLSSMQEETASGALMTCAWGERGAWGRDVDGKIHYVSATRPRQVVDTLGAGDVFNAGVIHGLLQGRSMPEILAAASRLAGRKCGRSGLGGLMDE
jgi:ketohexokinase